MSVIINVVNKIGDVVEIRKYISSDFFRVVEILRMSFPEINDLLEKSLISSNALDLDDDRHMQLVAVLDNQVVGYTLVSKSYDPIIKRVNYWIEYVCVDEAYRGRGVARMLLTKVEEFAKMDNVLYLQLTSSRIRESARKLYLNLGYEIRESDIFRKVLSW